MTNHRRFTFRVVALAALLSCGPLVGPAGADIVIPGLLAGRSVTPGEKAFQAGVLALNANDLAKAEASFSESLKLDAKAAAPYMGLAQVAIRRGQGSIAEGHMRKALELAPNTASIQTSWGAYLYSQRELPEAETALRKATKLDPKLVVAHVQLGDLYMVGFGKPAEAVKEYHAAVTVDPLHPGARYAKGLAHIALGQLQDAETELLHAVKLAPTNPLGMHALGRVYREQSRFDKALAAFADAIRALPTFAAPHLERGHIFAAQGDDPSALREYAAAQQKDPKRSAGYMNIGMVHQRHERWADAETAYLAAVKVEPTNALALNNLAWMAAERRVKLDNALVWAQKARTINPDVPEFWGTLGWVFRARGDLVQAEAALAKAAGLQPQRPLIVLNLGRVYLERGKKTEAAAAFKKALAIDPKFSGADEARKLLKELGQG